LVRAVVRLALGGLSPRNAYLNLHDLGTGGPGESYTGVVTRVGQSCVRGACRLPLARQTLRLGDLSGCYEFDQDVVDDSAEQSSRSGCPDHTENTRASSRRSASVQVYLANVPRGSGGTLIDLIGKLWCCKRGLNSRPLPYQGSAKRLSRLVPACYLLWMTVETPGKRPISVDDLCSRLIELDLQR
jgi:hypothetical protein